MTRATANDPPSGAGRASLTPELLAQVRRIQIRTQRMVNDVMSGGYTSVFRGSGIEFDQVREYADGDEIRAIDWNVTARTGELHVKQFMEERELTVLFVLDLSRSMGFGTRPAGAPGAAPVRSARAVAAEFCACLALAAQRNNDKTGLIAFSDRIELFVPAKKGSQHVLRLIRDALAIEPVGRGGDLAAALEHAARVQRKKAVVFVVSDFEFDPATASRALRLVARRHDVIAVRVADPVARRLPKAGLLRIEDLETGRATSVDTGSRRVREAFAARVAAHDAALQRELRRAGVDLLELATRGDGADGATADLVQPILKFFRMRELRGSHG